MAKRCIFCDRKPTTRAHIFRKGWMDVVFPGVELYQHRHVRRGTGGFDRAWGSATSDFKVKCACEGCNSGWMDRLDHAAEDLFLTNAATVAAPTRLARYEDKELLARWCLLIAVLFDQLQGAPVVDSTVHRDLYEERITPGRVHIWLLRTDPPEFDISGFAEPSELRDMRTNAPHAYLVSFGIKHLVAQVYVLAEGLDAVTFERTNNAAILRQLWPPPMTAFHWPPQAVLWSEREKLNKMFNAPEEELP